MKLLRSPLIASTLITLGLAAAAGTIACGASGEDSDDTAGALTNGGDEPLELTDAQRATIVEKKATCPFVGVAVAMKKLLVYGTAESPLAHITGEGSVTALGDTGSGSNLGSAVLSIFAKGNHHFMAGSSGKLDQKVPEDTFSLDFPGSQGSHPGHSGILQTDPLKIDSGAFSAANFQRLVAIKRQGGDVCESTGHAEQLPSGQVVVRRSEIGKFIAENLKRDPASKVAGIKVLLKLGVDSANFAGSLVSLAHDTSKADQVFVALTKILGEDNLVGSAGEFGLLMAFLENSPKTVEVDGEPAVAVDDLKQMFAPTAAEKRFPEGWETWKKTRLSWTLNTLALTNSAALAHAKLTISCK